MARVDVADGTAATYDVNLARVIPRLGDRAAAELRPDEIAGLVAELHEAGLARESIRKTLTTLRQALDFAGVVPNPVRDRTVKLPREKRGVDDLEARLSDLEGRVDTICIDVGC